MGDGAQAEAGIGEGRLIGGRYRLAERLGHGGMGTVWRAVDETVRRDVAAKEPRPPEGLSDAQRDRFFARMLREARSAASVTHPNVVTLHDVVMEQDRPWLMMELVRGRSLADVLDEGTLPPREAARIGLAVVDALAAVHAVGVLHRDVKPANVLLADDGRVVLTDFGIAHVEGEAPMTETGAVAGSPEYVAPERVNGLRPGPPSDLWSLGVLLYAAVEGWSPFRRATSMTTMLAVRDEAPPPPARAGALGPLLTDLLAKDPAARPDAAAVRTRLKAVAEPPPPPPPPPGPPPGTLLDPSAPTRVTPAPAAPGAGGGAAPGPAAPWHRRTRPRLAAAGAAAVVAAGLVLALTRPFGGGDDGIPEHWEKTNEGAVHMKFPVPAGYRRSDPDDSDPGVRYTSPDKRFRITVYRSGDPSDSDAAETSDSQNDGFEGEDGQVVRYGKDYTAHFHGRTATEFDGTDWESKKDKAKGRLSRELNLIVFNKSGKAEYWFFLNVHGTRKFVESDAPRRMFDRILDGAEIPDLGR